VLVTFCKKKEKKLSYLPKFKRLTIKSDKVAAIYDFILNANDFNNNKVARGEVGVKYEYILI